MSHINHQRFAYIDIVKGFAIIAVVLLHVNFTYPQYSLLNIRALLGGFWHVPVFFCIGGFFIKEEKLLNPIAFIKNKFKSLYLLALYFYLPATLLHNFLFKIDWYSENEIYGGKIIKEWNGIEYIINVIKTLVCAGREPIMGAMWFIYALFFALCGFSIISFIIKKFTRNGTQYEWVRFLTLLILQIISCITTEKFHITIPRFSNAISVMLLIYMGQQIKNRFKFTFDNHFVAILSALIFYQSSVLTGNGIIQLNGNNYQDVLQLTIGCLSATYLLCYIAIKIEHTYIGKLITICGKESFYIMVLHIVGFKLCSTILLHYNIINGSIAQVTTPELTGKSKFYLLILYTLFGVAFPILSIKLFRILKNKIMRLYNSYNN